MADLRNIESALGVISGLLLVIVIELWVVILRLYNDV